jgi:hypothetical protein
MTLKIAYFQPTIMALDTVPALEFSRIYGLVENLHSHPELNDSGTDSISIRGGQQIQVYPNQLNLDVSWLIKYLETVCHGYMEIVNAQSGTDDLKHTKPVVVSIWTIRQGPGDYQEMHSHPMGNISGNIYISAPDFAPDSRASDGQLFFRMHQSKDITKFIMNDSMKLSPDPGSIIVFPSHLPHTVYPWRGTGHRTILAFDAVLRPIDE